MGIRGKRGFARNPVLYKAFLLNFLKRPLFNRKYITLALESVFKSQISRDLAYFVIKENKDKIRSDLQVLVKNPDAYVESIEDDKRKVFQNNNCTDSEETSNLLLTDHNEKSSHEKLKSAELIESINREMQRLKDQIREYEKNQPDDDEDEEEGEDKNNEDKKPVISAIPPVPGSINIKDLKRSKTPPLIDLTEEDEEEQKVLSCNQEQVSVLTQTEEPDPKNIQDSENLGQIESINFTPNLVPSFLNNLQYDYANFSQPLFLPSVQTVFLPSAGNLQLAQNIANGPYYYLSSTIQQVTDHVPQEPNT